MEEDILSKLEKYVDTIGQRIDQNFLEFDSMITLEDDEMALLSKKYQSIDNQLESIAKELANRPLESKVDIPSD